MLRWVEELGKGNTFICCFIFAQLVAVFVDLPNVLSNCGSFQLAKLKNFDYVKNKTVRNHISHVVST